MWISCSL